VLPAGLLLIGVLLLASGCVYLRLKELRHQLSHFREYFVVEREPCPSVIARKPVLLVEDLTFLTGLTPSPVAGSGETENWSLRFVKETPVEPEPEDYDITVTIRAQTNLVAAMEFPPRFAVFLYQESLEKVFRRVDDAAVSAEEKEAAWRAPDMQDELVSRDELLASLGQPTIRTESETELVLHYQYRMDTDELDPRLLPHPVQFHLTTRKADGALLRSDIRFGKLRFVIDFEK